jgi:hypothetical protein
MVATLLVKVPSADLTTEEAPIFTQAYLQIG